MMGLFGGVVTVEGTISIGLVWATLVTLPLLLCAIAVARLARCVLAVRTFGTVNLTSRDIVRLMDRHPAFRVLQAVATILALIFGALLIQAGYMAEVGCNCTPVEFSPLPMFN